MFSKEQLLGSLDKEGLMRVLSIIPEREVMAGVVVDRVKLQKAEDKTRFFEKEFRELFKKRLDFKNMPEHKIDMCLTGVDYMYRILDVYSEYQKETYFLDIENALKLTGLFDLKIVDPDVEKEFRDEKNWKYRFTVQNTDHYDYVGDPRLQDLIGKYSHFNGADFRRILQMMQDQEIVKPGSSFGSYRINKN